MTPVVMTSDPRGNNPGKVSQAALKTLIMKIFIIGYVWPEPESSAAGLRDWNLIETFLGAGWQVGFGCSSPENSYSDRLRARGISVHCLKPNDPGFDSLIREMQPDCVVFDRFMIEEQFGWRVREQCPEALRIIDTVDLHFLRRTRESALSAGFTLDQIKKCQFEWRTEDTLREMGAILRSDCSLVLSDYEVTHLVEQCQIPAELLHLLRFHYPAVDAPSEGAPTLKRPEFEERRDFVMIGNFRHHPNADAVRWFHKEIWPLIRSGLPEVQVHIYGAYPPKEMMSLTNTAKGFYVKGSTPDQFATLSQYRVNLAPLRFGAGIKGKITDGWWSGTPVVGTPISAEGMSEDLPWGGEIAQDPEDFAQKAVQLYENRNLWQEKQANGFHLLQTLYSKEKNEKNLVDLVLELKRNKDSRRQKNLMGAILNHQLYRSTKYFSKWIEAKSGSQVTGAR